MKGEGLERFLDAQAYSYQNALTEIRDGRKRSHWMWYIFPQIRGLGHSGTAQYYAIRDKEEARAYLTHPILGARLLEISRALLELETDDPSCVMGWPDDMKLRSSMTLFALVSGETVFRQVLDKFFGGQWDAQTERLLQESDCLAK